MFRKKKQRTPRVLKGEKAKNRQKSPEEEKLEKAVEEKKQLSKRQALRRSRRRAFYSVVVLFLAVILGISVFNVISAQLKYKEVMGEQERLLGEKEKLIIELSNINNLEYIEQQARLQLKMTMPGELLYVLPELNNINSEDMPSWGKPKEDPSQLEGKPVVEAPAAEEKPVIQDKPEGGAAPEIKTVP